MLNGVHIFCFLACYTIALALEVSRLVFRSKVRALVTTGLMVAGLIAHVAFLYNSAVKAQGSPLSSYQDWLLLAAAVLVLAYFYLRLFHASANFGVFLLPLVLALILVAAFGPNKQFPQKQASQVWGIIHGTSILLATVSVLIGFAAGLMYLEQDWRLKNKRGPWISLRLPSLEWLQQANSRSLAVSLVMMALGLLSGVVLNHIPGNSHSAVMTWNDPVVLGTWAMFLWLLLQAIFAAAYRPIREGRKMAYLTLASFGFLVLALVMTMLPQTRHGGTKEQGSRSENDAAALRSVLCSERPDCGAVAAISPGSCSAPGVNESPDRPTPQGSQKEKRCSFEYKYSATAPGCESCKRHTECACYLYWSTS